MKIKDHNSNITLRFLIKRILKRKRILFLVGILLYSLIVFWSGAIALKSGFTSELKSIVSSGIQLPINYLKGLNSKPVDKLFINIKFKNLQILEYNREQALSINNLNTKEYVRATIKHNNKTYEIKLRLKGDHVDHLEGKKWSFRIIVKGDKTIYGMKQFSVHHPKTRNYLNEWLFHRVLSKENIISLRYKFVNIVLNGEDLGLYALEEHFEKRLIENNQRKEGVIIRFNEDLMWKEITKLNHIFPNAKTSGYGEYSSSNIDAFQTNKILSDSVLFNYYLKAISLLESFRNGELSTKDVFDIEKLSSYFAITDILGAQHGARWHNMRFYFNPITSKLEPIGFDGDTGNEITSLFSSIDNYLGRSDYVPFGAFHCMIIKDKDFYYHYVKKMVQYSQKTYLDSIFMDVDNELNNNLNILYKEWPYYRFRKEIFYKNQAYIREMLNPPKAIHAYLVNNNKIDLELALGNIQSLPVKILGVVINDSIRIFSQKEIILPAKISSETIKYINYSFEIPEKFDLSENSLKTLKIRYELFGTNNSKVCEVFLWNYLDMNLIDNDFVTKKSNVLDFNFISVDKNQKIISFKSGDWTVTKSIHIPKGFHIILKDDTRLDLINSASIISYSPLYLEGSIENPIVIKSSDSTGQGIFVLNTNERSILNHVNFKNLSNPSKNGWELSGAITFYNAEVSIKNCIFYNNIKGDDYLNIISSKFNIENTTFNNVFSDAFDGDFCNGSILDSEFVNCGNDAIDISGTNINLENIIINSIGDKALSVGEKSRLVADNITIENSEIAVCSKDQSKVLISNIYLKNDKIGFTAFQKKSEFGPSSIEISKFEVVDVQIPYLIEKQSELSINGEIHRYNNESVKDLLYGVKYGKSSK
jgi:hypothetical protein